MAWNHRAMVVAMAVAIQPTPGVFAAPNTTTDLLAVSVPNNNFEAITADDPTATGGVWKSPRVYLGKTGTAGASIPLRGPGGAAPPAANAWPVGRILQTAGFAEIILAAASTAVAQAGGTATAVKLAAAESAVNDFWLGAPLQHANIGAGFRQTTMITSYNGGTKMATVGETIGVPIAAGNYTIPAHARYVLGTLTAAPPMLSVSIWRDKKRYDYRDWRPTSLGFDVPVSNEANQSFPTIDFAGKGTPVGEYDDVSPILPNSILALQPAAARGGKFYMDRVKLGHQSFKFGLNFTVGAPSNQNADAGQDSYDILDGDRSFDMDLNQSLVADFPLGTKVDNQTIMPVMTTWGAGAGNNFGIVVPDLALNPFSPGERNGFVSVTGSAVTVDVDKAIGFAVWW